MKFGLRTPSLKKSLEARTTGRAKRAVKKARLFRVMVKKEWDGLKIPKRRLITKFIIKHHLAYGIFSSKRYGGKEKSPCRRNCFCSLLTVKNFEKFKKIII